MNAPIASAQTKNPSTTPAPTEKEQNINILTELKDKIASKVAQLNLTKRQGIMGTVESTTSTQITLMNKKDETRFVDVDEFTKFSSPSAKGSFGISDLTKGSFVEVIGLYNKQSRRILARFVNVTTPTQFVHGAVSTVNKIDNTISVISQDGKETVVDIENVTKIQAYDKNGGLTKLGLSKVTEGLHIIAVGFKDIKNPSKIIGSRVILFPNIPKDPRIPQQALQIQDTPVVSSGSGKKLTPITK